LAACQISSAADEPTSLTTHGSIVVANHRLTGVFAGRDIVVAGDANTCSEAVGNVEIAEHLDAGANAIGAVAKACNDLPRARTKSLVETAGHTHAGEFAERQIFTASDKLARRLADRGVVVTHDDLAGI